MRGKPLVVQGLWAATPKFGSKIDDHLQPWYWHELYEIYCCLVLGFPRPHFLSVVSVVSDVNLFGGAIVLCQDE